MGLFGDGSRARARQERKAAKQAEKTARVQARQQGKSYRVGEGNASSVADAIGAIGNAATGVLGGIAPGGFVQGQPGAGLSDPSTMPTRADIGAPEKLTDSPYFVPGAAAAALGGLYLLTRK